MSRRKNTTQDFIIKAIATFGELYDYSKVEYVDPTTKVEILCKEHGSFFQTTRMHLDNKTGCPKCTRKESIKADRIQEFIEKANNKHGYFYSYAEVNYVRSIEKVVINCPLHGKFEQMPKNHLEGKGCRKCAAQRISEFNYKDTKQFKFEAEIKHENLYNYENLEYTHSKQKVLVTCKKHGEFKIRPDLHLQGHGCPRCARLGFGGYSRSDYIKKANGRECIFYTIKCFNEQEEFYKIGITMNSIKSRYKDKKDMSYEYEVINEIKGSAEFIWNLEVGEKRRLKEFHYTPKIAFKGSKTECFTNYKYETK